MNFSNKMKQKWDIKSNWDFFIIMVVFSLAGMAVVFVRKPLFAMLGVTAQTPMWAKTLLYIPLIIPIYQLNLIVFGFLLGQFEFFWKKQKQVGKFLLRLLNVRSSS